MELTAAPYLAARYVTHAFLPAMLAHGSGTCVFVNSAAWFWSGAAPYTGSHWAVRKLFEAVKAETTGSGVRAAMVTFAKVRSDYWANNPGSEEWIPKAQAAIPVLSVDQAPRLFSKAWSLIVRRSSSHSCYVLS